MKYFALILLSVACYGQTTIGIDVIKPGSSFCTGVLQHSDDWNVVNGTGDVQVSAKMTCNIPISSFDTYIVIIKVFEPLTTINNGQRVFTININGESKTIDIKRLIGASKMLDVSFIAAAEKTLNITFEASARTALWSQIAYQRMYSNILPIQIQPTAVMIPTLTTESIPLFPSDSNTTKNYTLATKPADSSGLIIMLEDGTGIFRANAIAAKIEQNLNISLPVLLNGSKLTLVYWK